MMADQKKSSNQSPVIFTMLPVLAMLIIIVKGVISGSSASAIAQSAVVTLVLTGAVMFYIRSYGNSVENQDLAKSELMSIRSANIEMSTKLAEFRKHLQFSILDKLYARTIITIGYLGSLLLLLFIPDPGMLYFWMLGGLLIAMLLDSRLGLFINFNLVFILSIILGMHLEIMVQLLIFCILLSLLSGSIRDKASFFYALIILLSVNVTLSCAINNFDFKKIADIHYVWSLLSIVVTLFAAFIISVAYRKKELDVSVPEQTKITNEMLAVSVNKVAVDKMVVDTVTVDKVVIDTATVNTVTVEVKDQETVNISDAQIVASGRKIKPSVEASQDNTEVASGYDAGSFDNRTSYEILCDSNNLLLKKLEENSAAWYAHALFIGDLSGRAAEQIGADAKLAKAGGLYHEIGKINGQNYIEEGLKLAEDYAFPKELTAILREHNIKYDKPSSVEAAIVMLSDSLVSTIEYIEKTGDKKFTPNKIIENIFQMRFDKGTFDSAGISLKDYKILKEFYQTEFGKGFN